MATDPSERTSSSLPEVDQRWAEWIAVKLERVGYTTVVQAFDFPPGSDLYMRCNSRCK